MAGRWGAPPRLGSALPRRGGSAGSSTPMVQSDMSKSPPSPAQEVQMELLDNPPPAAAAQVGPGVARLGRSPGAAEAAGRARGAAVQARGVTARGGTGAPGPSTCPPPLAQQSLTALLGRPPPLKGAWLRRPAGCSAPQTQEACAYPLVRCVGMCCRWGVRGARINHGWGSAGTCCASTWCSPRAAASAPSGTQAGNSLCGWGKDPCCWPSTTARGPGVLSTLQISAAWLPCRRWLYSQLGDFNNSGQAHCLQVEGYGEGDREGMSARLVKALFWKVVPV